MNNDLKIQCLNAAGLVKPDKAAFMETIENALEPYDKNGWFRQHDPCIKRLIGQILRYYQHWPRHHTRNHDFKWLMQAYNPDTRRESLSKIQRHNDCLFVSDGYRVHMIDDGTLPETCSVDVTNEATMHTFFPSWPPLQIRELKLSDFRNVEADLLAFNGHTYDQRFILEAFSGNDEMLTPDEINDQLVLLSKDGNRAACIAPLRT